VVLLSLDVLEKEHVCFPNGQSSPNAAPSTLCSQKDLPSFLASQLAVCSLWNLVLSRVSPVWGKRPKSPTMRDWH
jgi:hypothetical protein